MSKVFVIPDVHLKPWMFEKATELIEKNKFDKIGYGEKPEIFLHLIIFQHTVTEDLSVMRDLFV